MPFAEKDCYIKTVWCGKGPKPVGLTKGKKYTKKGTSFECLRQGIGAGVYTERKKNLAATSLQNISYVGDLTERKLRARGIRTIAQLLTRLRGLDANGKRDFLRRALRKEEGGYDGRAFNSILVFAHSRGVTRLPPCKKL
jgi:hypothetical protein